MAELRKTVDSFRFIIITGNGDETIAVKMMKEGASDYLIKDTGFLELLPEVVRHVKRQILADEELRATQRELAARMIELQRSNAELEQFCFVASHDLREPLRKIITFGDFLREEVTGELSEDGERFLGYMQKAARRMQSLISGLLDLSRISSRIVPFEQVNLNEVVNEIRLDFELTMTASNASIETGSLPTVWGDANQLYRLFQNLIENALKYARPGVPPLIKISSRHIARTQNDIPPEVDHDFEITIADNGIGFDPKFAKKVFEIFARLKTNTEHDGVGIGLAICDKILQRHHGTISVISEPGVGTAFTFTLPDLPGPVSS